MKKLSLCVLGATFVFMLNAGAQNSTLIDTSFYSESLNDTMLVKVYLPPCYEDHSDWYYPVIYYLHSWGGTPAQMNEMISLLDNNINDSIIDPVMMVCAENYPLPFGGSMYVNSVLFGNYEDYMINDLVSWMENSFRAMPEKNYRGLMGHSMGGNGSFRYGILYKDRFRALAGHAGIFACDSALWMEAARQKVLLECQPGPPYFYDFYTAVPFSFTQGCFMLAGAYSPDTNCPQTYINPQVVDFIFDENGDYIDSVVVRWQTFDILNLIHQLTPSDSVGIYFGCGTNDSYLLYPGHIALKDTLDTLGLPYEFYSHSGAHTMPPAFKMRALTFLDSLMMPPGLYTGIHPDREQDYRMEMVIYPNPTSGQTTLKFDPAPSRYAELTVWDCMGQKIRTLTFNGLPSGLHEVQVDLSGHPAGVYFLLLQAGGKSAVKKIIKL